jgi:type IV secretory pathway protease TraF
MRNFIVGALLVTAAVGGTPALAQNESESAKSGLKAPVMGATPAAVPAEQRVTVNPGTNVVNAAAAQKLGGVPPIQVTLESAIEFIADDELVEITPKSIRIRKRHLAEQDRKRASRAAA